MVTGVRRANRLTRCGIALLAHDGSEFHPHIRKFPFVISFNPNPRDRAPFRGLLRPCNSNVVLCPARRHTGLAARASVQIHCHSPSMCHKRCLTYGLSLPDIPAATPQKAPAAHRYWLPSRSSLLSLPKLAFQCSVPSSALRCESGSAPDRSHIECNSRVPVPLEWLLHPVRRPARGTPAFGSILDL